MKSLSIDLIRTDGGTQMRAELDRDVYMDYRDKFLAGVEFPEVDVFHDGSTYWLADGFHRFYGAREAKRGSIKCKVHQGTVRDAILFAVGANQTHGMRRSNADKRNSVMTLLNDPEWVQWSGEKIAEVAGVGKSLVSDIKKQLSEKESSLVAKTKDEPKMGKDGKKRKLPQTVADTEDSSETEESDDPIGDACTHEWDEDDCCKHCKMENPDKPEPVTDAFGKAVPESLHDVFGESKKWQQAMSFVSSAKGAVTEIKGHRAAMHLDSAELDRLLSQARTNLKFAAPHTECVKCRRKIKPDCPHCRGEGWLNKATYTSIASEADIAWQENRK